MDAQGQERQLVCGPLQEMPVWGKDRKVLFKLFCPSGEASFHAHHCHLPPRYPLMSGFLYVIMPSPHN